MTHEVFRPTTPGGDNSNTPAAKVNRENPIGKHRKFPDQLTSEIDVDRIAAEGKYTFCREQVPRATVAARSTIQSAFALRPRRSLSCCQPVVVRSGPRSPRWSCR